MQLATRTVALGRPGTGIIATVLAAIAVAMPSSTAHADYCEVIGCWRECRPVPGGRWCRNVCQRRCWREPRRYQPPPDEPAPAPGPEPHYAAPSRQYTSPSHGAASRARDPLPGLLVLGGVGVILALLIAAVASAHSARDDASRATEETERETAATTALIATLEAAAREADRHLDRFLADTQHPPR